MFSLFKPRPNLRVSIKAPASFETSALNLPVALLLSSPTQQKITKLSVKLRADPAKHATNSSYSYIGEAVLAQELVVVPNKPEQQDFNLSLDFSPIDNFDIPPENLAVASEEMKAAAAANRTTNYKYSIEVNYKTDTAEEQTIGQTIRLIQQNEVRAG